MNYTKVFTTINKLRNDYSKLYEKSDRPKTPAEVDKVCDPIIEELAKIKKEQGFDIDIRLITMSADQMKEANLSDYIKQV